MKVLITGGSGLIGKVISQQLLAKGHQVVWLSRKANSSNAIKTYEWNPETGYCDANAFEGVDAIINLAGAAVNAKWTPTYKAMILNSRVDSLNTLYQAIMANDIRVKILISTSGVGFYPNSFTELFSEESEQGSGFLSKVCHKWEQAALQFENIGIRTSIVRVGVVLSDKGGALKEMARPVKFGVGSPLASGKQWMPWIHVEDIAAVFIHLLENDQAGIFNGAAPNSLTNRDLTKHIAKNLKRPMFMPNVPAFVLKLIMGETASIALSSTKVSAQKLLDSGFVHQYPDIDQALSQLFQKK